MKYIHIKEYGRTVEDNTAEHDHTQTHIFITVVGENGRRERIIPLGKNRNQIRTVIFLLETTVHDAEGGLVDVGPFSDE